MLFPLESLRKKEKFVQTEVELQIVRNIFNRTY